MYSTAKGYVQSAYLIIASPIRNTAPDDSTFVLAYHLLLGFAVELYLKAYLTEAGHTERELRSAGIRHNLNNLLELSVADGFNLPTTKPLVSYLSEQHESFEFRYMKSTSLYFLRAQSEVFDELNHLDAYVDRHVGASASSGKTPSSTGWIVPAAQDGWRIA